MSLAEDIVKDIVTTIQAIQDGGQAAFKKVEVKFPTFEELENIPSTLFPFVAVVPEVPVPQVHNWKPDSRDPKFHLMNIISEVKVRIHIYAQDNVTPLTTGLDYVSKVFSALVEDLTRGGNAQKTEVYPRDMDRFPPFLSIVMEARVSYKHDATSM